MIDQWFEGFVKILGDKLMELIRWLQGFIGSMLGTPDWTLFTKDWFLYVFNNTWGLAIVISMVVLTVFAVFMLAQKGNKSFFAAVKSAIFIVFFGSIVGMSLTVAVALFDNIRALAIKVAGGATPAEWLATITPDSQDPYLNALLGLVYVFPTAIIWAVTFINQYCILAFVILSVLAIILFTGGKRAQNWSRGIFSFGMASILVQPVFLMLIGFAYRIVNGVPVTDTLARAGIGAATLWLCFVCFRLLYAVGAVVFVKSIAGSDTSIDEGNVNADVNNEPRTRASIEEYNASLTTINSEQESVIVQNTQVNAEPRPGSGLDMSWLTKGQNMESLNRILDQVPTEAKVAAGAAAGLPPQVVVVADQMRQSTRDPS